MKVFEKNYAGFYDSLYTDKNYTAECDFIENVFRKYRLNVKTVLDLGCGTGSHAIILAKRRYKVAGVDRSAGMLEIAREKADSKNLKIEYTEGDIRKATLNKKFDAVICMFAVMGYQTSNADIESVCRTARKHLKRGGVFIFDCWFGPAVLGDRPVDKVKEMKLPSGEKILRLTRPELDIIKQTVKVNFKVMKISGNNISSETEESHLMRFFFPQELFYFLESAGFREMEIKPFLKLNGILTERDWNISVIGR